MSSWGRAAISTAALAMERVVILLCCALAGRLVAAQSMVNIEDFTFPEEFPEFSPGIGPFPFEENLLDAPYDTIFSAWPTRTPDFHMLGDWPSVFPGPRVEAFCDDSRLLVLVGKDLGGGVALTGADVRLGDGCYRTSELPKQFVFAYQSDECGTSHVVS